jgi:hypothetical protein
MKRIDTSTKSIDLFGAGKDGWKDGNKVLGIMATVANATWFNAVQEELANAIEGAGLALDPANNAQLSSVLQGLMASGRLIGYQEFTVSGNYTPATNNPKFVIVEVWGGGGGGGGAVANTDAAGGGGAGGYSRLLITSANLLATESITIGSGGSAGSISGSDGGNGGTSSFGVHCSATGGLGGKGAVAQTQYVGGLGGSGVGGDLNLTGNPGGHSSSWSGNSLGGLGGATVLGGAGGQVSQSNGLAAANNSGSGGGGACSNASAGRSGGIGGAGFVIVWEYR